MLKLSIKWNNVIEKNLFCKTIPLLDPIHYLLNNYSFTKNRNPFVTI